MNNNTTASKVFIVSTKEGAIAAYLSADQAEDIAGKLNAQGIAAWFDELPINPHLVTHIATADRNTLQHGASMMSVSTQLVTLDQARAIAGFVEQDGKTMVGYGFGTEPAISCMLDRAGLQGGFIATELAT